MRRITYIYERPNWPHFRWDHRALSDQLAGVRRRQGRLLGRIESLGINPRADATDLVVVTIHSFDDGNGRIARAIADMALARSENTGQRCYSMSSRLRIERPSYYATLEAAQKGELHIRPCLSWFLTVLDQALSGAETALAATLARARFWEALVTLPINERQRTMLNRLLDGFAGKLTSSKWAQITKCSQDTALRDIEALLAHGLLAREPAGGRSTGYALNPEMR